MDQLLGSMPPVPTDRNHIANELYMVTETVLNEVRSDENELEFLQSCYIVPKTSNTALKQACELLSQRIAIDETFRAAPINSDDMPMLVSTRTPEKPLIILGNIGHGKTTFLRYLRKIQSKNLLSNYVQIDVNFLDRPDSSDQVGEYIYDEIEKDLLNNYETDVRANNNVRGFLNTDIDRFPEMFEGMQFDIGTAEYKQAESKYVQKIIENRHLYLGKVFDHFRLGRIKKGKGHSIAIFLDNLDQRSDSIQEEAFLRASSMARDWSALVFICLRPSTFYRSRRLGVLDSVAPNVVSVNSPGMLPKS